MLILILRFNASGSFLFCIADLWGKNAATASRVGNKVYIAVTAQTSSEIENTVCTFHRILKIPSAMKCIDCTSNRVQCTGGENYVNFPSPYKLPVLQNRNNGPLIVICRFGQNELRGCFLTVQHGLQSQQLFNDFSLIAYGVAMGCGDAVFHCFPLD